MPSPSVSSDATNTTVLELFGRHGELANLPVSDRPFDAVSGRQVTASFGVSFNTDGTTFDHAYARTDQALYVAKRGGRNRVVGAYGES